MRSMSILQTDREEKKFLVPECGHEWMAPWIPPPGQGSLLRAKSQRCCLREGHEGPHMSMSKVIASNTQINGSNPSAESECSTGGER